MLVALSVMCLWPMASSVLRSLSPRHRSIRRMRLMSLAAGLAALILSLAAGSDPAVRATTIGCLVAAVVFALLGTPMCALSRRRAGGSWLSANSRLSGSHLYIWFDAIGLGLSLVLIGHAFGNGPASAITAGVLAALVPAVVGSVRLHSHHHGGMVSEAGPLRLPAPPGSPQHPVSQP